MKVNLLLEAFVRAVDVLQVLQFVCGSPDNESVQPELLLLNSLFCGEIVFWCHQWWERRDHSNQQVADTFTVLFKKHAGPFSRTPFARASV